MESGRLLGACVGVGQRVLLGCLETMSAEVHSYMLQDQHSWMLNWG
jgi:hypothetical protein